VSEAIIDLLKSHGEIIGRDLQGLLRKMGYQFTNVGFYVRMAKLEDQGLVHSRKEAYMVRGFKLIRWCYSIKEESFSGANNNATR